MDLSLEICTNLEKFPGTNKRIHIQVKKEMQIGTVERQGTKLLETTSKQSEPVEDAGLAQNPFCKNMKSFILL
jgi:hypothetical protein